MNRRRSFPFAATSIAAMLILVLSLCSTPAHASVDDLTGAIDSAVAPRLLFGPNYSAGKFNTTVAFTIPLFAFRVPALSALTLGTANTASIVSVGFLIVLTVLVLFVIPLLGYAQGRTSREDLNEDAYITDYLTNLVYDALNEISSVADDTCTERTVCEVWRNPHRFGYLAAPLQLLYPPDGHPGPRQKAALLGVTDTDTDCKDEYNCELSIMDILLYLTKFVSVEAPF